MENWESIQRSRERELEALIQKQRERHWQKSTREAQEHFKLDIVQRVEQGLAEYSIALRRIAADVGQAGTQEIIPEETVMISRLVRGLTRQLAEKYCPDRGVSITPLLVPPPDAPMVTVLDDTDPPTPASISQWSLSGCATDVKAEPQQQNPAAAETDETGDVNPENAKSPSRTVTPQGQMNASTLSRKDKRPLQSIETDKSSSFQRRTAKRPRCDSSNWLSETIEQEPTEPGSIHCREVEGQDFIFSNDEFPGFFFVIRCDRDSRLSGIVYRFTRHPLEYNRASKHFNKDKPREKCHEEDVKGGYTDHQLIVKFGYRVYGDDLEDKDWVARSNDKTLKSATKGGAPVTPGRARGRPQPKENLKGKEGTTTSKSKTPTTGDSRPPTATTAGPSTTARSTPKAPEIGPARRSRPSLGVETGDMGPGRSTMSNNTGRLASSSSASRIANVAPVADMGVNYVSPPTLRRRNPSRPASRTSSRLARVVAEEIPDGLPAVLPNGTDVEWAADSAETNNIVNELLGSLN